MARKAPLVDGTTLLEQANGGRRLRWASRLLSNGHGGQILLAPVSGMLLWEQLPPGVSFDNLGAYYFGPGDPPESLFQLVGPEMLVHSHRVSDRLLSGRRAPLVPDSATLAWPAPPPW